ncbi:hypothetical protein [uncultured Shimia sp.]|uniref:hypothetical protein n=1 Tax=uncultured Shimia sp. TaxID=573152 RepID=UPI00262EF51F|nr:hypothetical protein [uncultured Shimia sp.]
MTCAAGFEDEMDAMAADYAKRQNVSIEKAGASTQHTSAFTPVTSARGAPDHQRTNR